jgi:molybdate transport system ATP-binding protein
MKKSLSTAFYITHDGDKDWLMQQLAEGNFFNFPLSLSNVRGEVFSNKTLQYFIEEELRHDHFEIAAGVQNTLSLSSSGEQRKALLSYIVAKNPGYIIVENVFDSLDKATRQSILSTLHQLAEEVLLIQIFSRKDELLPFVETIYIIEGNSIKYKLKKDEFAALPMVDPKVVFTGSIPPPLKTYGVQSGPLVKMNEVEVAFNGRTVLQKICWEIHPGEFWQLIGPNGSGKSTLLSLITGNSSKGYGQDLFLFGHKKGSGETVWDIKANIGYFTPTMTQQFERQDSIEQMIISGFFDSVGLYIHPSDIQVQLAREWLKLIGMYQDKQQPFRMFPEGKQRMILIARAMVKHPPLLILDEPTAGLDDEMAALFTALINKIAAESNTTILYVSHKEEPGLSPGKIFELVPTENGSVGQIIR